MTVKVIDVGDFITSQCNKCSNLFRSTLPTTICPICKDVAYKGTVYKQVKCKQCGFTIKMPEFEIPTCWCGNKNAKPN